MQSEHFTDEGRPMTGYAWDAIAHHASGRAIVGLALGRKLMSVGMNAAGIIDVQFESADEDYLIFAPIDAFAGIAARAQFDPSLSQNSEGAATGHHPDWSRFCELVPNADDQKLYIAIVRSLVRSYWPQIQAVARPLSELARLSGAEVSKIIGPILS